MLAIVTSDNNYINNILEEVKHNKEQSPPYSSVYKCNYKNHEFLLVVTGYGKVNIGSTLRYICDKYPVKVVLAIGTAGSILDTNDIFSAVIPINTLEFDVDFTPNGFAPGVIPKLKKGMYKTNDDLTECLVNACKLNKINYSNDIIATSDMFVCNYSLSNSIRREYNAGAVDCEAGCIGQFAYMNDIPYATLKVISNYANSNGIKQYNLYDDEASIIVQKITNKFLKLFFE